MGNNGKNNAQGNGKQSEIRRVLSVLVVKYRAPFRAPEMQTPDADGAGRKSK
jgi:hypothetical protein